jgi:hypothetical protein
MQAVNLFDPRDYYSLAVGIGPDYDGDGIADAPGRRRGPFGNPMMATLLGIFLVLVVWYFLKNRNLIPGNLSWGAQPSSATRTIPEPIPTVSPLISLGPIGPTEPQRTEPSVAPRSYEPAPRNYESAPAASTAEVPVPAQQVMVPTDTLRVKNSEGIYLWDCLDAGCQRLSLLRQNTRVALLGETTLANSEEWVRVRVGNQVGWVSRYYLE